MSFGPHVPLAKLPLESSFSSSEEEDLVLMEQIWGLSLEFWVRSCRMAMLLYLGLYGIWSDLQQLVLSAN